MQSVGVHSLSNEVDTEREGAQGTHSGLSEIGGRGASAMSGGCTRGWVLSVTHQMGRGKLKQG